ncbi:MAG: HAD hydrolase-like protein, partial [Candidatus Methanomethylophilaceae archaeon]
RRCLVEACEETNPLLERVKFLAIAYGNMDEFFMIRMPAMIGDAKNDILSGKAAGTDTVLIDRDDLKVCDEETVRVKDLRDILTPYRRC